MSFQFGLVLLQVACFIDASYGSLNGNIDTSQFKNLVIIPDVHGDMNSFIKSLWMSFIEVDRDIPLPDFQRHVGAYRASGDAVFPLSHKPDETVLIQLGDVINRGPFALQCLEILKSIEETIGWKTIRLYGNHELMAYKGTGVDYIHKDEFAMFEQSFGTQNARIEVFGPGGVLWDEISKSSILSARVAPARDDSSDRTDVLPIGSSSTLFVHGGIDSLWLRKMGSVIHDPEKLVSEMNKRASKAFTSKTSPPSTFLFDLESSPLWTRDLAELNHHYVCDKILPRILKTFNVARLVVAHTPQRDRRMKSLCHSRLILADALMSRWMYPKNVEAKGNPTALIMNQSNGNLNSMYAMYMDSLNEVISKHFFSELMWGELNTWDMIKSILHGVDWIWLHMGAQVGRHS